MLQYCSIIACSYAMATPNKDETVTEDEAEEDAVPEEIEEQCIDCHHALASLERLLKPLLETTHTAVEEKLTALDNASLTLLLTYSMNSLFWVYLNTQGINPKTHNIKTELERVQKYMHKTSIISQRLKGDFPQVNKEAAKRFVKSALWEEGQQSHSRKRHIDDTTDESSPATKK